MSTFTDTNFTYAVLSDANKTLSIVGVNSTTYSVTNPNWGAFPPIPLVYGGANTTYNGNGNPANAYKITEIGTSAFESRTAFSNTPLTPTFLTSNLTRIGAKAFMAVKLVGTLTIPENIASIGTMAFYNCTLITNIVIGSVTNSNVVSHLSDLTAVLNQEILDRKNADDSLNLLKAPINDATLTGTAKIPTAEIAIANIATANITNANIVTAIVQNANIATKLDVSGNVTFSDGSVSTTGQWAFTVQPKYNGNVIATEPFVNDKVTALAGEGLSSTLNTLSDLATAIGNDPSLATTITNGNTNLLNSISAEISTRNSAVTSLSSALSASNSSLLSTHAVLSTGLSTEISVRGNSVTSLSTALSASSASLSVVDSTMSTGISAEVSTRTSEVASLSTVLSASASSLIVVDSMLSTATSSEVSTRVSTVASLSKEISTHRSALVSTDTSISTAISTETVARSQSVSLASSVVSAATSSVTSGTASLTAALSVENSTRQSGQTSLSTSVSGAASVLRTVHLGVSGAFVAESTALSSSVAALSAGTSLAVSGLISANASLSTAISTEKSVQISQTNSFSVSASGALNSIMNANTSLGNVISTEVSVRNSQVQSVSSGIIGLALPSLATVASNLSTSLSAEKSTATSALSVAMSTLKGNAPTALDTLAEIANELNTNPSLTQIASVMADVTATSNALSAEVINRASALTSVSTALSSSVVALTSADASISTVLSGEVVALNASAGSVSASISATASTMTLANNSVATVLASEVSVRAAAVAGVSSTLSSASVSLVAVDSVLSTAISSEVATRAGALVSFSTSLSTANVSLAAVHSLISTSISAENSTRTVAMASVSSGLSTSASAMQTAINAVSTSIAAVSSEAALKTTTAYLSAQISAIIGGAPPDTLNTLAEIGAALNNENNFAGTVTTALGTKADATVVAALSTALAQKANQTDYTSLSTVVTTKATDTTANNTSTSLASISNAVNALQAEVSTMQASGINASANPDTISVNNVSLLDLQNWTNEIYAKMGLTNADGTNKKLIALKNPAIISSTLGFEYDANRAVTKVKHLLTVQFDKDQKSVTVTGGVGNPTTTVNNMALDASGNYVFTIPYVGNIDYYAANKTAVSITALETQYKLAPTNPTVNAAAPNEAIYKHATPVVGTPYASVIWDSTAQIVTQRITITADQTAILKFDLGGYTSSNITILPFSNAVAVQGETNQFTLSATSAQFDVNYARSLVGTGSNSITATSLASADKLTSVSLTITGIVNDVPQHAVPTLVSNSKLIASSGSTFTYTGTFTNADSAPMEVFDASSNALAADQPTVGSPYSYAYDSTRIGSNIFKIRVKDTSSKRASAFLTVDGEDIARFATPTMSSISYSGSDPYVATMTWNVDPNVTSVSVKNSQAVSFPRLINNTSNPPVNRVQLAGVSDGQKGTISVWWEFINTNSGYIWSSRANNSYGEAIVMYKNGQNIIVHLRNRSTVVGNFYTTSNPIPATGNYHLFVSWDLSVGKYHIYVNGVKQALDGSVTTGQTISYSQEITRVGFGARWFNVSSERLDGYIGAAYVNYVEYVDPVTSIEKFIYNGNPVFLGSNGSLPTGNSPIVYLNSGNGTNSGYGGDFGSSGSTTAMSSHNFVALPAGASVTTNTISTNSGTKTANLVITYSNSVAPLDIILIADGNGYGRESIMTASTSKTLIKAFTTPVLSGSVGYSGYNPTYNANMTFTVQSGVTELNVLKSDLTPLPTGASIFANTVSGTTANLQITHATSIAPLSIVVIAKSNLSGHASSPSAAVTIIPKFDKPVLQGISYSGTGPYEATMTYTVNSPVTALLARSTDTNYNIGNLPTGASITSNTVSGTTATMTITYTEAVAPLRIVAYAAGNSVGRESDRTDMVLLYSSTIRNVTFTNSATVAKDWYFNFDYDGTSLSSFTIGITWFSGGGPQGGSVNMDCLPLISSGSSGSKSLLIADPNGWLDIALHKGPMIVGKTANVSINYTTSGGLSKNITTSFVPRPVTGLWYPNIFNINSNTSPGTFSFTIQGALDAFRRGIGVYYYISIREVGTGTEYILTVQDPYANGVDMTWNSIPIPIQTFGRTFTSYYGIGVHGYGYVGNYSYYSTPYHNNTFTVPLPTTIFPTEFTDTYNMGMNWGSPLIRNDVRLFRFMWYVNKYALDPASPTYVAKVRISLLSNDYAGTSMTNLVYNYADGVGYAMSRTGQFPVRGNNTGNWRYTIRPENADGTVVGPIITKDTSGGPMYSVAFNAMADMGGTIPDSQLYLNTNLTDFSDVSNLSTSAYTWNSGTSKYATNVSFKTVAMFRTSISTRKHKFTLMQGSTTIASLGEFEMNNTTYTINVSALSPSTSYVVRINLINISNGANVYDTYGNPYQQDYTLTVPAAP
jgi:hypothetical protein